MTVSPVSRLNTTSVLRFGGLLRRDKTPLEERRLARYRDGLDTFVRTQHDPHRLVLVPDQTALQSVRSYVNTDWGEAMEGQISKIVKDMDKGRLKRFEDFEYAMVTAYRKYQREHEYGMPRNTVEYYDSFGAMSYGERYEEQAKALMGPVPYYVFKLPLSDGTEISMTTLDEDHQGWARITPANPKHRDAIDGELGRLYDEVRNLKPQIDAENAKETPQLDALFEDAVQTIARFHWIFAQAMPYKRGSAGVADAMTKCLFEHLGIAVPRWKEGYRPDLDAFTKPLDEFVAGYGDHMAYPPAFYTHL